MAMIELYLIRHGLAAERGKDWPDDSKRPLTPEGIARLRKEARGLNAVGVTFDQIVTSPLIRARQTADVFSEELKSRPPIVTADGPRLLNSTSIPLAEDPAAAVTDCTEMIKSARAVVEPRRQAATPAARTNPSRRYLLVKLNLDSTTSSNLR